MTRTRTLIRAAVPVGTLALAVAAAAPASAQTDAYDAYDTDGNGYYDAYGFDDSGDGYEDTWAIDWDENGLVEQVAVDTDLDGLADTFAFDSDEDGYVEEVGVDTTYNALPDVWGADSDLDGYVDAVAYDVDDDGTADWSEPLTTSASAYASVTYVFAEADGWVYWEVGYEVGYTYGLTGADRDGDGGLKTLTGSAPASAATADLPGDDVRDLLRSLTGLV